MEGHAITNTLVKTLGEPFAGARAALRPVLIHAHSQFSVYRESMAKAGISTRDLQTCDPLGLLEALAPLEGDAFYQLADEAFATADEVVDLEASSGTTGHRKRRVITYRDEIAESKYLARLFRVCGLGDNDRVACLDTGPLTLMVSFTRALEEMGVAEAYALSAGPDPARTIDDLLVLDPTAIITVPSVLERCLDILVHGLAGRINAKLRSLVYVGEPLRGATHARLVDDLGLEVFAYYGASETSALGMECRAHDGIHLFNEQNFLEISTEEPDDTHGRLLVTTLHQEGLPLLRYALGDLVKLRPGPCTCGLPDPRVDVIGRTNGSVSLLGVKVSYDGIRQAAYREMRTLGPIEVVLTDDGGDKMTIVLPNNLADDEQIIRRSLTGKEPDLAYLFAGKFVELELAFVDDAHFRDARKEKRVVDLRRG